jgi:hypothetical protein
MYDNGVYPNMEREKQLKINGLIVTGVAGDVPGFRNFVEEDR